jgi:hypothetical protein
MPLNTRAKLLRGFESDVEHMASDCDSRVDKRKLRTTASTVDEVTPSFISAAKQGQVLGQEYFTRSRVDSGDVSDVESRTPSHLTLDFYGNTHSDPNAGKRHAHSSPIGDSFNLPNIKDPNSYSADDIQKSVRRFWDIAASVYNNGLPSVIDAMHVNIGDNPPIGSPYQPIHDTGSFRFNPTMPKPTVGKSQHESCYSDTYSVNDDDDASGLQACTPSAN